MVLCIAGGTSYSYLGVGGVIGNGYAQTITVHNCTMSGEMQISDGSLGYGYLSIGGVCGHTTGAFNNCSAIGKSMWSVKVAQSALRHSGNELFYRK